MNKNLLGIIKRITAEQGEGILSDPKKLKAIVSDYAKDEPKEDRVAFGRTIENGFYDELKYASSKDRPSVKASLVSRLQGITGFDAACCRAAVDLLEEVIYGGTSSAPVKTVQAESTTAMPQTASVQQNTQKKKNILILITFILGLILTFFSFGFCVILADIDDSGLLWDVLDYDHPLSLLFIFSIIASIFIFIAWIKNDAKKLFLAAILFIPSVIGIPASILCLIVYSKIKNQQVPFQQTQLQIKIDKFLGNFEVNKGVIFIICSILFLIVGIIFSFNFIGRILFATWPRSDFGMLVMHYMTRIWLLYASNAFMFFLAMFSAISLYIKKSKNILFSVLLHLLFS